MKIEATGELRGKKTTVVCVDNGEGFAFTFNGKENDSLQMRLEAIIDSGVSIGGTYYPETIALKIVAALEAYFFDSPAQNISVDGDLEQIPFEEDTIY